MIICRDYKRIDVEEFFRLIEININNINITKDSNINTLTDLTIDMIVKCIDTVAPRRN